ncbi:MAG TPA: PA domain-containing protein [Myxococcales bacterium]|jgi:uncharacterized repeat protein (TIGR01451 family)/uncharacterized protein (TIGR03382 family)
MRLFAAAAALCVTTSALAAELRISNQNAANQGFNDTTAATPVGLNFGTTKGAQAVIDFQYAAAVWGAVLKSPVPIVIDAAFVTAAQDSNMTCNATTGLLGYTHPNNFVTGAELPNHTAGYVAALANALLGRETTPGQAHIFTRFNAGIGGATCLAGTGWYYGLDGVAAPGQASLLTTLLHEFAHGLGFTSFVNPTTGDNSNAPAIFDFHVFDETRQSNWAGYTAAQRKPLLTAGNELSFDGASVAAEAATYLSNQPVLDFAGGGAAPSEAQYLPGQFSGPVPDAGASQSIVPAAPLDACSDLTSTFNGSLALIERGTCNFYDKAQRAQAAGASGVVVFDNDAGSLITMASVDGGVPLDVPAVFITNNDGNAVLQRLDGGTVTATFGASSHLSNTDPAQTRVLLYTPPVASSGSTLSHWNAGSFPRTLLMEPFIGASTRLDLDLTPNSFADMGWPVVTGLSVGMSKAEAPTLSDGEEVKYLVAIVNRRTADVAGVQLDLTLPAGATFVSAAGLNAFACAALPCAVGTVTASSVLPLVVTLKAPSTAVFPFVVTAQISAPGTDANDNLSATISVDKTAAASSGGGGCSTGGVPAALVVLLAFGVAIRARRRPAVSAK